ncbi:amidohydrolase [Brevibacillus daliensis]|uniref:amidohydrolase n=1 Tax=Brevibacillus daliensis TaxID=2892995 RepID=UPI001E2F756E|nr:amidohydrolase [Brevibacillus daliensis]
MAERHIQENIQKRLGQIAPAIVAWRRDFHRHPEVGWTEFRTASLVADVLEEVGFQVLVGQEVMNLTSRMGVPSEVVIAKAREKALKNGANLKWLDRMVDGCTGVVGVWDTGKPGPTIALRFDMDALPVHEEATNQHVPARLGFRSEIEGQMHACGHDGHTAIGLGVASILSSLKETGCGRIKLIFQPAEEGARGAKAMVEAGVVSDVDLFVCGHIGLTAKPTGLIATGVTRFFASTKIDVTIKGVPAHAALAPEKGKNALLAAAAITLQLQGISRHSGGDTRINVGMLEAGEGRNIIPSHAKLTLETRGVTNEVNDYMTEEVKRIVKAVAMMYNVEEHIEIVGRSIAAPCDELLMNRVKEVAISTGREWQVVDTLPFDASEDATYFMEAVQKRGGLATYTLFGTELSATHHHHAFDYSEETLLIAVELLSQLVADVLFSEVKV